MLKTIKTTKQMRLDELIEYVWDNQIYPSRFINQESFDIWFDSMGGIKVQEDYVHNETSIFRVEVEEEIAEDMMFDELVERYSVSFQSVLVKAIHHENFSIHDVLSRNEDTGAEALQIYALINNKLELIWERED